MATYAELIAAKESSLRFNGIDSARISGKLFPFQRDLVRWALAKGRGALFADTGLGKTCMQIEWSRHVSKCGRVLILAPLAVAQQTVREAHDLLGVRVAYDRDDSGELITITNYEMLDRFDPAQFAGIVLDESSILKAYDGKTRNHIIGAFADTPFRLACTATPAPNDHMELGNHSEFLGVKTRVEMLAEYFCHDGGDTAVWRLKGHARLAFWRWVSSWAAMVRHPRDLGDNTEGFDLPPLEFVELDVPVDHRSALSQGRLFLDDATTLTDQRDLRRTTMQARVDLIANDVASHGEPSIVWCELNAESDALTRAIDGAVEVKGSDSPEVKAERLLDFAGGKIRVLVTKPSIAGFGLNWQHCRRVYFVGPSHSYEQTYQAIRRCWRFGQKRSVIVSTCVAATERHVSRNYERKRKDAETMGDAMSAELREHGLNVEGIAREWNMHNANAKTKVPSWL